MVTALKPVRLLMIEDSEEDAEALVHELEAAGGNVACERIDSDEALATALGERWDAILCDYVVPNMDWERSLQRARKSQEGIPFIVVSGKRGEEFAVETMRAGCSDYVVKDRLMRLWPAVRREVEAAAQRQIAQDANRLLEEELQRARKLEATGRLAGGLAHNLNNVLTVIMAALEVVLADGPEEDEDSYLQDAAHAAERAAKMVRQLAGLGQEPSFTPGVVVPELLMSELTRLARPVLPKTVKFHVECEDELPAIVADAAQLEQALLNLILNARDALPSGGSIALGVRVAADEIVFRVSDDGTGMTGDVRERIFEPFYSTKGAVGTGLGLASVYHSARAHGGRVTVDSAPGLGSSFELSIPLRVARPGDSRNVVENWQNGTGYVLVVDDAEDVLLRIQGVLTRCGYEVATARDYGEAIEILSNQAKQPDAIIADSVVREGGARNLLGWLRERERVIPVIVTSSFEVERWETSRLYEGFAALLPKPFTSTELATSVARVLDGA